MPSLAVIQSSLKTDLPTTLTAIFVGGTSGIGSFTALALARHVSHPTIHIVGRTASAGEATLKSLKSTNPNGVYHLHITDVALLSNVDKICNIIASKEPYINILYLSQGAFIAGVDTTEGIHLPASLVLHSRIRFIVNLLPLLSAAPNDQPKRVVSIFTGTKDGPITNPDFQMRNLKVTDFIKMRGQAASMVTLSMEDVVERYKVDDVGFVHVFPGAVKTSFGRGDGVVRWLLRGFNELFGRWLYIGEEEVGDRGVWVATTERLVGTAVNEKKRGEAAKGTNGMVGSGVYVVDEKGEVGSNEVVKILNKNREEGWREKLGEHIFGDFVRVTGKERITG